MVFFALAILPLFPVYFLAKPLREHLSQSNFLGYFLIVSSFFLFFITFFKPKEKKDNSSVNTKIKDVLFIGVMQSLALIPGISRSASTIFAAHFRGWGLQEGVRFSYLLAIPTIMGGSFLESFKAIYKNPVEYTLLPGSYYFIGFIMSFMVGFLAIRYIFSLKDPKKLRPFAWYCLVIGCLSIAWLR